MNPNSPQDHYDYPQHPGVLIGKLNIYNATQLQAAEAFLSATRITELNTQPLPGSFDMAHLQALHRYMFQDLYPWAGELRIIDIVKGQHAQHAIAPNVLPVHWLLL